MARVSSLHYALEFVWYSRVSRHWSMVGLHVHACTLVTGSLVTCDGSVYMTTHSHMMSIVVKI